jgi:hypothetical protein
MKRVGRGRTPAATKTTGRAAGKKKPIARKRVAVRARPASPKRPVPKAGLTVSELEELEEVRRELERAAGTGSPLRWNADPEEVRRSVAQLVLTLVEFIRKLLERQAIRRMEAGTLTDGQTEDIGRALMTLEETVRDIADQFGIPPEELNLDLGPLGRLM